jgi:hypothetical protein
MCHSVSSWCRRHPRPCAPYTTRVMWGRASHAAPPPWATPARDPAAYGQRACHLRPAPHLVGDWDRVKSIAEALSCARPSPRRRILRPPNLREKAWRERGRRHPPSAGDGRDAPGAGDGRGQAHATTHTYLALSPPPRVPCTFGREPSPPWKGGATWWGIEVRGRQSTDGESSKEERGAVRGQIRTRTARGEIGTPTPVTTSTEPR